ncbi:hypothetical protein KM043_012139 [Ampulex compressa]|nr:hypothetical protein KM043_012139 [Ampulex compressa]
MGKAKRVNVFLQPGWSFESSCSFGRRSGYRGGHFDVHEPRPFNGFPSCKGAEKVFLEAGEPWLSSRGRSWLAPSKSAGHSARCCRSFVKPWLVLVIVALSAKYPKSTIHASFSQGFEAIVGRLPRGTGHKLRRTHVTCPSAPMDPRRKIPGFRERIDRGCFSLLSKATGGQLGD